MGGTSGKDFRFAVVRYRSRQLIAPGIREFAPDPASEHRASESLSRSFRRWLNAKFMFGDSWKASRGVSVSSAVATTCHRASANDAD